MVRRRPGRDRPRAAVFAPTPQLTVTIETRNGADDLHLHAGGQAVWIARMLLELGVETVLCAPMGGESGNVLRELLATEGITLAGVDVDARTGAYVDDRRSGDRVRLCEMEPDHLGRHDIDELYSSFLALAASADVAVAVGPVRDGILRDDTYERLARDIHALRVPLVADLDGRWLRSAAHGGTTIVKVSDEDLLGDDVERPEIGTVRDTARDLLDLGAGAVVVSRAEEPGIALLGRELRPDGVREYALHGPVLSVVDHHGAGDSMTAGMAAALAHALDIEDCLRWGAAAGALNVTRHGLGTGPTRAVTALLEHVRLVPLEDTAEGTDGPPGREDTEAERP